MSENQFQGGNMTHHVTVRICQDTEEDQIYAVMYRINPDNFRMKSMDEQGEITHRLAEAVRRMKEKHNGSSPLFF
jgi:transcription initiation factor IIE alpha subunit